MMRMVVAMSVWAALLAAPAAAQGHAAHSEHAGKETREIARERGYARR